LTALLLSWLINAEVTLFDVIPWVVRPLVVSPLLEVSPAEVIGEVVRPTAEVNDAVVRPTAEVNDAVVGVAGTAPVVGVAGKAAATVTLHPFEL